MSTPPPEICTLNPESGLIDVVTAIQSSGPASGAGIPLTTNSAGVLDASLIDGSMVSTSSVGVITDTMAALATKPAVGIVAASNVTLSGVQLIDGITGTVGITIVLCTAQIAGAQNGPWVMQSGAWTRPSWYPSGGTTQAFKFVTTFVRLGTTYQGTVWRQTAAAPITIDTTATVWVITPLALNSSTVTIAPQAANRVQAGPTTGAAATPTYRALVAADIPFLNNRIDRVDVGLWNGGSPIAAGTYVLKGRGLNIYGTTYTITAVRAYADAGSASTVNVADSGANALLTAPITAGTASWTAGNQSATTTVANGVWTDWTIVADGTATIINAVMTIAY